MQPAGRGGILVLLHGIGSDERDLLSLAPAMPAELTVVSLRAPLAYGPGYAWFDLMIDEAGMRISDEQALESRLLLIETLERLPAELNMPAAPLWLLGFSQGAMMTFGCLCARPDLLEGAILISGAALPVFQHSERLEDPCDCLVIHGEADETVPVDEGRKLAARIQALGAPADLRLYDWGHTIGLDAAADIHAWLDERR